MRILFYFLAFYWVLFSGLAQAGTITGKAKIQGRPNHSDIVVYVEGVRGDFQLLPVRPEMNHINLQFDPPLLAVLKGSTVDFPNSDPVFHSGFSISPSNPFDLGLYGKGKEKFVQLKNPGLVEIFCHIHSHMHAYILVLENPYFAMTGEDGSFSIANVPDGSYTLKAWMSPTVVVSKTVEVKGEAAVNWDFTLVAGR